MKRIMALILAVMMSFNAYAAWDGDKPAGSDNISDLDTLIQTNNSALENTLGGLTGWQNLSVAYTSAASVTITADSLYLQDSTGISYRATTVSEVATITTAGASGLVTALSEASSTWYYVYIARKSSDGTTNAFLSTSAVLATVLTQLDAGYNQLALVSAVRNDGSSNFISFRQGGRKYSYSTWQTAASGAVTGWIAIDMTAYVPSALSDWAFGSLGSSSSVETIITNDNSISTSNDHGPNKVSSSNGSNEGNEMDYWNLNIITANTLYWESGNSGAIYVHGFELNKI